MVCSTCSKKMEKLGGSEMHKEEAEGGGGKEKLSGAYNKLLQKGDHRVKDGTFKSRHCKLCQSKIQRPMHYCAKCGYKKGLC